MNGDKNMKPTSILRYEFIQELTKLINNSQLPSFVIEPILKDMYYDVKNIAQKQLEADYKELQQKQNSGTAASNQ